jgi:hypothetical protein
MIVRNFYLHARMDGRHTPLAAGPAGKDGGFELVITQRHRGAIQTSCEVSGIPVPGGGLELHIRPSSALDIKRGVDGCIIVSSQR